MSTWITIIIAVGIGIYIYSRIKHQGQKYGAAKNALMAKYTFSNLDLDSRKKVEMVTLDMLRQAGFSNNIDRFNSMTDRERYSFYAMAMAHLGIEPQLGDERWSYVENPFVALIDADKYINNAKNYLKNNYNIDISLY